MAYRVGYWIGSQMTRVNGTYRMTVKVYQIGEATRVRRYYEECGYLTELRPVGD